MFYKFFFASIFVFSGCVIPLESTTPKFCYDRKIDKVMVQPFKAECSHPRHYIAEETETYIVCKCG